MNPYADPADAIQVGLYQLLSSDPTLRVRDGIPEDQNPPFVTIGEVMSSPDGSHSTFGRQTTATIHTWTRAESMAPGNAIGDKIGALLSAGEEALDPLVAGHVVWMVMHEYTSTQIDPEPGIRHRIDRFRIYTSQG